MRAFVLGNYMHACFMHVDRLPCTGESLAARRVDWEHGGKGLNLGLGLHRLGAEVHMIMAVGADLSGVAVCQALVAEGMSDAHFLTLGDASGFGVGFVTPEGANFLATHLGANALLEVAHLGQAEGCLSRADWLLAHFEMPDALVRHAFRLARAKGLSTYLNPSPWRDVDRALLDMTDLLVVNASEASVLFGDRTVLYWSRADWCSHLPRLAAGIGWRGRALVVTLAEEGCVALDAAGVIDVAAFSVTQVDATGAGDAFGCGLVHALARGEPLTQALRFANACGAHVASRAGVFANLPRPGELAALLDDASPA